MSKTKQRLSSVLLTLCLTVALCAGFVLAAPVRVQAAAGGFGVDPPVSPATAYEWQDPQGTGDTLYITGDCTLRVYGTAGNGARIFVAAGCTVNLTLEDVSMAPPINNECPLAIKEGSTVNLTLKGTNVLDGTQGGGHTITAPGIYVPPTAKLVIQEGAPGASLEASGGSDNAGIGGGSAFNGFDPNCGEVIIQSGSVTATGGDFGAGIGGGYDRITNDGGSAGSVTIAGGTVTATGGGSAPGVGGGVGCTASSNVTVTGGTLNAIGGSGAAGVGGGGKTPAGGSSVGANLLISGPNTVVNATGSNDNWDVGSGGSFLRPDPLLHTLAHQGSLAVQDGATLNLLGKGLFPGFTPFTSGGGTVLHQGVQIFPIISTPAPAQDDPAETFWRGVLGQLAALGTKGTLTADATGQTFVPYYILQQLHHNPGQTLNIKTGQGTLVLNKARLAAAGIDVDKSHTFEVLIAAGLLSGGSPQTGDSSNLPLWALCSSLALAGLAMCGIAARKRYGRKAR